jgi:uncharacterized membrane protein
MEENERSDSRNSDLSIILLLLAAFCGLIGLLAVAIIGIPLPFAFVFIALAAIGLPCGLSRLGKKERKVKLILISVIASILLSPVYVPLTRPR